MSSCILWWRLGDCLARSRLTAIPRFVFCDSVASKQKALQPQLTRARTLCKTTVGLIIWNSEFDDFSVQKIAPYALAKNIFSNFINNMKLPAISNIKTSIKRYILPNCKKYNSTAPILVESINLKEISLEQSPIKDIFQKQKYSQILSGIKNDSHKEIIAKIFLEPNPMDEKTYASLPLGVIQTLRSQLTPDLVEKSKTLISISKIIKEYMDKIFGENQYTFVSIGRSLSALANCLKFMGVETKHIPLSNCRGENRDVNQTVSTIIKQKEFKEYKNFLEETLNLETNKRHIFCDYAVSGKTLEVFKSLLNHNKVQLSSKKDKFLKINVLLKNIAKKNIEYQNIVQEFNRMLQFQHFDQYAEIKYLGFRDLNKLDFALQPTDSIQNKLMKFCMLDMLNL